MLPRILSEVAFNSDATFSSDVINVSDATAKGFLFLVKTLYVDYIGH